MLRWILWVRVGPAGREKEPDHPGLILQSGGRPPTHSGLSSQCPRGQSLPFPIPLAKGRTAEKRAIFLYSIIFTYAFHYQAVVSPSSNTRFLARRLTALIHLAARVFPLRRLDLTNKPEKESNLPHSCARAGLPLTIIRLNLSML